MNANNPVAAQDPTAASAPLNGNREDILNAAIKVFGQVGYAAASTNDIVKRANVSKGLLFHHFKNKQTLYTACQLYVMEQYGKFMEQHFDLSGTDFFDRILSNLRLKMEFGKRRPELLALINRAWYADGEENTLTRQAVQDYIMQSPQGPAFAQFFEGIDTTVFREGLDLNKVLAYTRMILEASWVQYSKKHQDDSEVMAREMDDYISECEEIIALIRDGVYA